MSSFDRLPVAIRIHCVYNNCNIFLHSVVAFMIMDLRTLYMTIVQNDSYGLFRASHSHNPPPYSHSRVASLHFMLIRGRASKPCPHLCASAGVNRLFALESYIAIIKNLSDVHFLQKALLKIMLFPYIMYEWKKKQVPRKKNH